MGTAIARIVLVVGLMAGPMSLAVALGVQSDPLTHAERLVKVETKVEALDRQYSRLETLIVGIIVAVFSNLIISGLTLQRRSK